MLFIDASIVFLCLRSYLLLLFVRSCQNGCHFLPCVATEFTAVLSLYLLLALQMVQQGLLCYSFHVHEFFWLSICLDSCHFVFRLMLCIQILFVCLVQVLLLHNYNVVASLGYAVCFVCWAAVRDLHCKGIYVFLSLLLCIDCWLILFRFVFMLNVSVHSFAWCARDLQLFTRGQGGK